MPPHKIGKSGIIIREQKVQFTQACPTAGFQGRARKTIDGGAFDASPPSPDGTVTAQSPTMLCNVLLAHGQQSGRIDRPPGRSAATCSVTSRDRSARWPQCFNVRGNSDVFTVRAYPFQDISDHPKRLPADTAPLRNKKRSPLPTAAAPLGISGDSAFPTYRPTAASCSTSRSITPSGYPLSGENSIIVSYEVPSNSWLACSNSETAYFQLGCWQKNRALAIQNAVSTPITENIIAASAQVETSAPEVAARH